MLNFVSSLAEDFRLLERPSEDALKAENDFQKFDSERYQARPVFILTLIYYLTDHFKLDMHPNLLPIVMQRRLSKKRDQDIQS